MPDLTAIEARQATLGRIRDEEAGSRSWALVWPGLALKQTEEVPALVAEVRRLRDALANIKGTCGAVCGDFELCTHVACNDSYAAWQIAASALAAPTADANHEERT